MKLSPNGTVKIEKKPLDVLVHQRLRDEIVSGEREPGSRLIQDELANELGVSRVPVRDALRRLEVDGLIDRVGVGFVVAAANEQHLADLLGLRLRIDGFAAELCAQRVTPALVSELEDILDSGEKAVANADSAAFKRFDTLFHEAIYNGTKSAHLRKCVFLIWNGAPPVASIRVDPARLRQAHEEHLSIFAAIRCGDFVKAEEAARKHVDRARSIVLSQTAGGPSIYPDIADYKSPPDPVRAEQGRPKPKISSRRR